MLQISCLYETSLFQQELLFSSAVYTASWNLMLGVFMANSSYLGIKVMSSSSVGLSWVEVFLQLSIHYLLRVLDINKRKLFMLSESHYKQGTNGITYYLNTLVVWWTSELCIHPPFAQCSLSSYLQPYSFWRDLYSREEVESWGSWEQSLYSWLCDLSQGV